jgi:hypothetical protein
VFVEPRNDRLKRDSTVRTFYLELHWVARVIADRLTIERQLAAEAVTGRRRGLAVVFQYACVGGTFCSVTHVSPP